jgi:hypothetical protein
LWFCFANTLQSAKDAWKMWKLMQRTRTFDERVWLGL